MTPGEEVVTSRALRNDDSDDDGDSPFPKQRKSLPVLAHLLGRGWDASPPEHFAGTDMDRFGRRSRGIQHSKKDSSAATPSRKSANGLWQQPQPKSMNLAPFLSRTMPGILSASSEIIRLRLAEQTLGMLRARMETEFCRRRLVGWSAYTSASATRRRLLRNRMQGRAFSICRRVLMALGDATYVLRSQSGACRSALSHHETATLVRAMAEWRRSVRIGKMLRLLMVRCDRGLVSRAWDALSFETRRKGIASAKVLSMLSRKGGEHDRSVFRAWADVLRHERSLYNLNCFIVRMSTPHCAAYVRAWRAVVLYNHRIEQAAQSVDRRWCFASLRNALETWMSAHFHTARVARVGAVLSAATRSRLLYFQLSLWASSVRVVRWERKRRRREAEVDKASVFAAVFEAAASGKQRRLGVERLRTRRVLELKRIAWHALVRELSGPSASNTQAKADRGMAKCIARLSKQCVRAWWDATRRKARLKTFQRCVSRSVGRCVIRRVFELWRESAEWYWCSAVKVQKVRGLSRLLLCGVYYATWSMHVRLRRRVFSLATRVWLRLGRDAFCEWGDYTDQSIAYAGRVEAGVARVSTRVASRELRESISAWFDKVMRRKQVENLLVVADVRLRTWWCGRTVVAWGSWAKRAGTKRRKVEWWVLKANLRDVARALGGWVDMTEWLSNARKQADVIIRRMNTAMLCGALQEWLLFSKTISNNRDLAEEMSLRRWRLHEKVLISEWFRASLLSGKTRAGVERLTARRWEMVAGDALDHWREKHARTKSFDRWVDHKITAVLREAYDAWACGLSAGEERKRVLKRAAAKLGWKTEGLALVAWRDAVKMEREGKIRLQHLLGGWSHRHEVSAFSSWKEVAKGSLVMRRRVGMLRDRVRSLGLGQIMHDWMFMAAEAWRVRRGLARVEAMRITRMLRWATTGWRGVTEAMALRERGLLRLSERSWLHQADSAMDAWETAARMCRRERALTKRLLAAKEKHLAMTALGGFMACVESARAVKRASDAVIGRTERSAACLALGAWWINGVQMEKRGERVARETVAKHLRARVRAVFKRWRDEMARGRRLRCALLLRDRRIVAAAANAWEEEAANRVRARTRIVQMQSRSRTRRVQEVVRLWIGVKCAGIQREVGLARILSRIEWHLLLRSVRGWAIVVGKVWESRRLEASVTRAMERVKVANATRTLRDWCSSKLARRRALSASSSKRIWSSKRKAFDSWEHWIGYKRQTAAALEKAMHDL